MSQLQTQYPLSSRKFWKKMIPSFLGGSVIVVVLGALIATLLAGQGITQDFDLFKIPFIVGMLIGYIIVMLLYAWYYRAYIRRYYYDANDNFVTIKKRVFGPQEIHVQYAKIQDVYVDQDILDRILGLYDVHLASATASSAIEAHIDGVEHDAAEGLKSLLLDRVQNKGLLPPQLPAVPKHESEAVVAPAEEISNKDYPIASPWIAVATVNYIYTALVLGAVFTFWIASFANQGQIFTLPTLFLWIGIALAILVLRLIYLIVWTNVYRFKFLPEYILMRSGFLNRSETHLPYRVVQDVNISQGIIERMFGLATVFIENAAATQMAGRKMKRSGVTIPGQSLEKANHIAEAVRQVILTKNSSQTGL